jgi:hypothetical protein
MSGGDFQFQVDRDASFAKLSDHPVEAVDADVSRPALVPDAR